MDMQRDEHLRTQGDDAVFTPRSEVTGKTNPADTLASDFQSPGP